MKALLDTNVLIDYFAKREPYYQDAFMLRVMHEFGDVELWSSIQSYSDIAYVLRNETNSAELQNAFVSSLSFMHVCSLDQDNLVAACGEKWPDFEDCLIEQCSRKIKAEFILTRDAEGFAKSDVTVLSPKEFFTLVSEKYGLSYDTLDLSEV